QPKPATESKPQPVAKAQVIQPKPTPKATTTQAKPAQNGRTTQWQRPPSATPKAANSQAKQNFFNSFLNRKKGGE
ncbi:MAG: hypothetical protein HQL72_06765, partial [Magnetococcales bacterium]|nr:hypothetical protein [Magnetococcales bacterium]